MPLPKKGAAHYHAHLVLSDKSWPINCYTSPVMILKITPSLDFNQWLKCLDTHLNEPSNKNSMKVPEVIKPTNKKTILQNLGDQCKQTNVPSLTGHILSSTGFPGFLHEKDGAKWSFLGYFIPYPKHTHSLSHTHSHTQTLTHLHPPHTHM